MCTTRWCVDHDPITNTTYRRLCSVGALGCLPVYCCRSRVSTLSLLNVHHGAKPTFSRSQDLKCRPYNQGGTPTHCVVNPRTLWPTFISQVVLSYCAPRQPARKTRFYDESCDTFVTHSSNMPATKARHLAKSWFVNHQTMHCPYRVDGTHSFDPRGHRRVRAPNFTVVVFGQDAVDSHFQHICTANPKHVCISARNEGAMDS